MKNNELVKKLNAYNNEEIYVKIDNGLFYPITDVKVYNGKVIISCPKIETDTQEFRQAKFKKVRKKVKKSEE